jgi:hypothetical protein
MDVLKTLRNGLTGLALLAAVHGCAGAQVQTIEQDENDYTLVGCAVLAEDGSYAIRGKTRWVFYNSNCKKIKTVKDKEGVIDLDPPMVGAYLPNGLDPNHRCYEEPVRR